MHYLELDKLVYQMIGKSVATVETVTGGGNNKIFKIVCDDEQSMAFKFYNLDNSPDNCIRLKREYEGLSFLKEQGEGNVPRPIAMSVERTCALYEWLDGKNIQNISNTELDSVVAFIKRLKQYSRHLNAHKLADAADHSLNLNGVVVQLNRRLERLRTVNGDKKLQKFLNNHVGPCLDYVVTNLEKKCTRALENKLSYQSAILSPSDFGFHNALRFNEQLVFIDFEYFGWDDPAGMMAQFLWHPGMMLTEEHKQYFSVKMFDLFADDPDFHERFNLLLPLIGMVWTLILLNEFIPTVWQRRVHAGSVLLGEYQIKCDQQVQKAQVYLESIFALA